MLGRGVRLLLSLAVLAATGVVSSAPCCAMERLSRPAAAQVLDCCDSSDCCRLENRGPAQAALSINPPDVKTARALPSSHPLPFGEAAVASRGRLAQLSYLETDHPPPRGGRDTYLRISLLRV